MSLSQLSSRAIIGKFYKRLSENAGLEWINAISNYFASDQDTEEYRWIGQSPVMREWVGGRHSKGFTDNGISIANKHFEATIDIPLKHLRRDKTGQIEARIGELATRTNSHWALLLSELINKGEEQLCYDKKPFFATDHREGKTGNQSNKISVKVTENTPTIDEMRDAILQGIGQIISFVDDQNQPTNEGASRFVVMVPVHLWFIAKAAIAVPLSAGGGTNPVKVLADLDIGVAQNTRLKGNKIYVFRADGDVKAFIRQEEEAVQVKAKAEGSEYEFDNDAHQYGVDTWRNVGYGYWQHACLVALAKGS